MGSDPGPPVISDSNWGHVIIDYNGSREEYGKRGERADVILWPTGIKHWDWNDPECPCHDHRPGVSQKAVQFLIDKDCEVIIISKGYNGVLQTSNAVLDYLKGKNVETIHEKSPKAVEKYNQLTKHGGKNIGLMLHSTC